MTVAPSPPLESEPGARPLLLLFVGTRGGRVTDALRSLSRVADVTIVTSEDVLAERADSLAGAAARDVVVAPARSGVPAVARAYADRVRVDGALTFADDAVGVTAAFAEEHGLPGQPVATMPAFRDKWEQRRALADAGVPVPSVALVTSRADVLTALETVAMPAILKPARGSGGALAYVVAEPAQLAAVVDEAFGLVESDAGDGGSGAGGGAVDAGTAFVLESLLVGVPHHPVPGFAPYVSVETVAAGGEYAHLAVTDRFPLSPPALETGMSLPSCLPPDVREQVVVMADRALRALNFRHGLAHTELMLTADGPRVIEVNARAGGALPYLFPLVSDVDLVEQAGRVALGLAPARAAAFHGYGVFVAPQHPVGVAVRSVDGLDEAAALPGVRAVIPVAVAGTRTDGFRHTLVAAVLGVADSPVDAVRLWQDVMRTIRSDYGDATVAAHLRRSPRSTSPGAGGDGVFTATTGATA